MNQTMEELNLTGSNDVIFKAIMFEQPNILKYIMQILMGKRIRKLKILNSELPRRQFIEKGQRLDAYLDASDEYVDVEVSTSYDDATKNRNVSYVCHIYCNAVKKGKDYSSYKKASIYNLIWGRKGKHIKTTGRLIDEYGEIVSDMINYHSIYMDKVMERYYNEDVKFILQYKYLIMLGLRLEEIDKLIEITKGDEIVKEYKKALDSVLNDDEIAPYIDVERDREMLYQGSLKIQTKEARKKGRQQGLQEGRKEGRKEGKKEGLHEGRKEIIKKLISKGYTHKQISDMLDLSEDEIKKYL